MGMGERMASAEGASHGNGGSALSRVLAMLEVPMLVAVPATLLACAALRVNASAALTLLVVLACIAIFAAGYESSKPALRQIMPTVVLAAAAAAGRVALAPFADVKPVSAIAIVAGAALGRRDGFMVGALAALVSNLFFGQGPWTPLQMYAWGLIGYLAGVLADAGALKSRAVLAGFGLASGLIYGLVMNAWHVVGFVSPITWQAALAAFAAGLPFDIAHGVSTVAFLLLIWVPWGRRIERTVRAYDLR